MAQQNSFGKALASADKKVRDKAVKRLSKYLSNKKDLSDLDLLKLWKGLFYCFWMSDKPLIQQQLSEKLASLILKIPDEISIKFIESFWKEIRLEWTGIDRLRLDKFYYLFRQMHLNSFKFLEKVNWDITHVIKYMDIFTDGPLSLLDQTVPPSLLYHACEVFIPELNKAITKPIPTSVFIEILEPFFDVIGFCSNDILVEKVIEELFLNIVNIYENEDANEEEESNIVKSCNFKSIYERLEKLNNEPLILKKNIEHIESLIVIFKGLSETQDILLEEEEGEEEGKENEEIEENEEEENENDSSEINKDEEKIEEIEESKIKDKTKGKVNKKTSKQNDKKSAKSTKKSPKNKEQSIEVVEDEKPTKKVSKKRKAEVEPIEIEDENNEEAVIEVIESPKKKRKTPARASKKEAKTKTTKAKTKTAKQKEEVIVINESDEEKEQKKSEPKVAKNIKKNNKKSKNTKDKNVTSESSLKSKNNNNNKNIKDKKIKASKSKEKNRPIETVVEIDSDDTTTSPSTNIVDNDLSSSIIPNSPSQSIPIIIQDELNTSKKSKIKTKNKTKKSSKNKKSSSSTIIDLTETSPKIIEKNKIIKKSSNKKKKDSKKEKNNTKFSKEEEAFVNKILRESNLIGDKSLSTSINSNSIISHPITTEKVPEKIKIESLIKTDSIVNQPKGRRGLRRSRAIDFF